MSERSGEHARIARLLPRLHSSDSLLVPNGDDAAVLRGRPEPLVATVDAVVEGVHFRRSFAPLDVLARRAVMGAASDLAAMGARPSALLVALVLPRTLTDDELETLMAGIEGAALELEAVVAGGNLSAGERLSLTTTALGYLEGPPLTRGGAKAGDGLFLTAPPGHAALGLESLLRGAEPNGIAPFRRAWLEPTAAVAAGLALSGSAHACVDLSDGLVQDLGHLCRASGVGATLELPPDPAFEACARALGVDPQSLQLGGGESYALLYAAPDSCGVASVRVGTVDAEEGIRLREPTGIRSLDGDGGFDHFSGGDDE